MSDSDSMSPLQTALLTAITSLAGADCSQPSDEDLTDERGLRICHVCGRPKQCIVHLPGELGDRILPCACDCDNARWAEEDRRRQLDEEQRKVDELFRYSLVDDRFRESTFERFRETPDNAKPLRIARNYVEHFDELYTRNKGLLLFGPPGTGKTYLASCIANALMQRRVPVIVTSIIRLTASTSPWGRDAEELSELLHRLATVRLLVIDDLGTERSTDFKLEQVFDVIDARYGAKKPMIITTNLTLDQMQRETDLRKRRVYERIFEVCHAVQFTGPSWRWQAAENDYDEIEALLNGD